MTIWNQIVNAVYRNEWPLIEAAIGSHPTVQLDDANIMAEVLGNIVAGRLRACETGAPIEGSCMPETIAWLLRQPYINHERFAEWVAMDALKADTHIHRQTYQLVAPHCRKERLREIEHHLAECVEQHKRAIACRQQAVATKFIEATMALGKEVRTTGRVLQLAMNDSPSQTPTQQPEGDDSFDRITARSYCTVQ